MFRLSKWTTPGMSGIVSPILPTAPASLANQSANKEMQKYKRMYEKEHTVAQKLAAQNTELRTLLQNLSNQFKSVVAENEVLHTREHVFLQ